MILGRQRYLLVDTCEINLTIPQKNFNASVRPGSLSLFQRRINCPLGQLP